MLWERYFIAENIRECLIPAFAFEGCGAEEHFIDQYTERPPIDCTSMTATFNNFWCNIFFRTDERISSEVRYAGFGVDCGQGVRSGTVAANNHLWGTVRARLFRKIKV